VLAGGELGALVVAEAATRLLDGVLGDERSAAQDSFGTGDTVLDCDHFTRPRVWRGREVPPVLLSGDHAAIERWRRANSAERTREQRPDLLTDAPGTHAPHIPPNTPSSPSGQARGPTT
jgi:tRNA (guanine37-N1)-methyltransferase